MRRALIAFALLVTVSCGGSSPTGPSGQQLPTIAGTYTNGANLFQFTLTRVSDGATVRLTCGGTVTINQSGGNFTGSFIQRDGDCEPPPISGTITSGSLSQDGGVSFGLQVPGTDPNALTAVFGCVYVSGSQGVNGAVTGKTLDAQATLVMQCPTDGRLTLATRIQGTRP